MNPSNLMNGGVPQQQQPGMNAMQRAQPGVPRQQLYALIMDRLRTTLPEAGNGWQQTYNLGQRATQIMEMITQLRMLNNGNLRVAIDVALSFEMQSIQASNSQQEYMAKIHAKQQEILQKRQERAQTGQMSMQMPGQNNMGGMPNGGNMNGMPNGNGMGGISMANLIGMPNMQQGGNNNPQQNQVFLQHLQRQMQPSPLPPQQQQPPATMDPSQLTNPGAMVPQQQMPGNMMQPQQPNMNMNQMPQQTQQQGVNQQDQVMKLVMQMISRMSDEERARQRQDFLSRLTDSQRNEIQQKGGDPLWRALAPRARAMLMKHREQQQQAQHQQQAAQQQPIGGVDFNSILGQQANAMKQQESGGEVVPASANPNGAGNGSFGGLMNMPPGINPAMLGNNQPGVNQQGGGQVTEQMKQQLMNQQRQNQERIRQQNLMAQQQAHGQQQHNLQNQLRGQPGGLNAPNALNGGPAGQVNSPAMSMLNRPMAPPGQNAPGTPQQPNRAPQPPGQQTPMNGGAQQLLQHHQQMLQQNNQGAVQQQGAPQQPRGIPPQLQAMLSNPAFKQKLNAMPQDQREMTLKRLMAGQAPDMGGLPQQPNMGMGGVPGPRPNMNGMPQNIPNFNSQPPPNQQPQPSRQQQEREQMALQQRLQQQQLQQQQQQQQQGQGPSQLPPAAMANNQIRQKAMDNCQFPRNLISSLGIDVPETVTLWGQLRQHLMRNISVLPPALPGQLQQAQLQYFQAHPEEMNAAMNLIVQRMRQAQAAQALHQRNIGQQMPNGNAPQGMGMPANGGQVAPPAQMVPPAAPMQQPPAPGPQRNPATQIGGPPSQPAPPAPVTPQDIALFRQKMTGHPRFPPNMNDEQIRAVMWKKRMESYNMAMSQNQQEALKNAQQMHKTQSSQGLPPPQQRPGQQPSRPQPPVNQGQSRPQSSAQPPSSDSDDVMEIPNPNAPPAAQMAQAPNASQGGQTQQNQMVPPLPPDMSREQYQAMAKMATPEQRTAFMAMLHKKRQEALRRAQQQSAMPPATQQHPHQSAMTALPEEVPPQIRAMYDEVQASTPKGAPVSLSDADRQEAQELLRKLWQPISRVHLTFTLAYSIGSQFSNKLKSVMKARIMIQQNVTDEHGTIRDYLSVDPQRLKEIQAFLNQYFREVQLAKAKWDAAKASQKQQQQGRPAPVRKPSQQATAMAQSASQQGHARKASKNQAPPAPIDNKSFDFGVASPAGIPKYDPNRAELTPDKLKFPQPKKRKPNPSDSQGATPVSQAGTPGAVPSPAIGGKVSSPEQMRKTQPQPGQVKQEVERKKFKCNDLYCEANVNGFETEELLHKHEKVEHEQVEDPLQYMLDNAAGALGLDQAGQPVRTKTDVKAQPRATPAPALKAGLKRDAQTPVMKQEVATPQSGRPQVRPTTETAVAKPQEPKERTLREVLEEKMGFEPRTPLRAPTPATAQDAAVAVPSEDDVFNDMLQHTLTGADGFTSDFDMDFSGINDWGLRPEPEIESSPELTPSSRASDISQSERLRINFEWNAWGDGDTAVPSELLEMGTLGLDGSPDAAKQATAGEDTNMADAEGEKAAEGELGAKGGAEQLDWSNDDLVDWDRIFGADAGLE